MLEEMMSYTEKLVITMELENCQRLKKTKKSAQIGEFSFRLMFILFFATTCIMLSYMNEVKAKL